MLCLGGRPSNRFHRRLRVRSTDGSVCVLLRLGPPVPACLSSAVFPAHSCAWGKCKLQKNYELGQTGEAVTAVTCVVDWFTAFEFILNVRQ